MVFASICEHVSRQFIFASTSSDQICLASSKYLVNFPLTWISLLLTWEETLVYLQNKTDRRKARQRIKILSRFNQSQQVTANYAGLVYAKLRHVPTMLWTRLTGKKLRATRLDSQKF